ncbi:hypothetical protein [Arthrobacter pigmenti]
MTAAVEAARLLESSTGQERAVLLVRPLLYVPPPLESADIMQDAADPAWYEIYVYGNGARTLVDAHEGGETLELVFSGGASPTVGPSTLIPTRQVQEIDVDQIGRRLG